MFKDFIPSQQMKKKTSRNEQDSQTVDEDQIYKLDVAIGEKKFVDGDFPDFTSFAGNGKPNKKNAKSKIQFKPQVQTLKENHNFIHSEDKTEQTQNQVIFKNNHEDSQVIVGDKKFVDKDFPDITTLNGNDKNSKKTVQNQIKPSSKQDETAKTLVLQKPEQLIQQTNNQSPLNNNLHFPDLISSVKAQTTKKSLSKNAQNFQSTNIILSQPSMEGSLLNGLQLPRQAQLKKEAIERDFKGLLIHPDPSEDLTEFAIQVKPKEDIKPKVFRIEDAGEEDVFDQETTNKLFNVIESIKQNKQGKLYFDDQNMAYLFALLLNETRTEMRIMKDSYEDENDYLSHILPSFINENLAQVKMSCEEHESRYGHQNSALPLRFILQIDPALTLLGKYLVLSATEGDYDQSEDGNTWKKWFFSEYQEFKDSPNYVVQVLVQQRSKFDSKNYHKNNSTEFIDLIGIIKKQKNKKAYWIYLPWNKRVINAFKIPNIEIKDSEYLGYKAVSVHKELIEIYEERPYANLLELFPHQFLSHVNPIMKPSTYLVEITALMTAQKSPYFQLILEPQYANTNPISKEAEKFGRGLPNTLKSFFDNQAISDLYNDSQRKAMIDACNYSKPITIINGPPGTGKTFTSLGIMSAILEQMRKKGEKGIILACAHSNTVINDWVRKIARASVYVKNQSEGVPINTIINSKGEPQLVKVLRIGMSDKCDPDIYDYALDIKAQRIFFNLNLSESDKGDINALFPNELPRNNCYSLTHVKRKILRINELMQELDLKIQIFRQSAESALAQAKKYQLQAEKSMLKTLFFSMKEILTQKSSSYKELLSNLICGAQIIVSTLTSSVSSILKEYTSTNDLPIQLLIIDEAPQCYEPSILTPLAAHNVRKLVLLGDHKQLGPIVHDSTNSVNNLYSRSLYERLIYVLPFFMLDVQYRSLPNLSALTSSMFYNNKVKDDISVINQEFPPYLKGLLKSNRNFIFFDLHQSQQSITIKKSYQNEAEAWAVTFLVIHLIQKLKNHTEPQISVISPYKAQVQFIKRCLVQETKDEDIFSQVEVNTVDSFQGKENDIMIISLVRSEGIGFLKDPRRVNVATSRAQYAQYIFGSKEALFNNKLWTNIYTYLYQRNSVVEYDFNEIKKKQLLFETILNT